MLISMKILTLKYLKSNNFFFVDFSIFLFINNKLTIITKWFDIFNKKIIYLFNNWFYSTNHKKISINYFWFVLLAGVVGMVLATLIRVEMAYPGYGILAGDNSQYLSVVSAHGVIMVFFMAMPLLFGFFTNFLLPTQLGVHDVAFPRMNSAAFWFLPASLIVLCQLVCVDRRYQRMNCFNMKEVESLVRNRFFYELLDQNMNNLNFNNTFISIKNKINKDNYKNNFNSYDNNVNFTLLLDTIFKSSNDLNSMNVKYFNYNFINIFFYFKIKIYDYITFLTNLAKFIDINFIYNWLFKLNSSIFYYINFQNFNTKTSLKNNFLTKSDFLKKLIDIYGFIKYNDLNKNINIENIENKRFINFENPNIKFKVKIGNYLPKKPYELSYDHLISTFNFKTVSSTKSLWINSNFINSQIINNFNYYIKNHSSLYNKLVKENKIESIFDFYFFITLFYNFNNSLLLLQSKWLSFNYFDLSFINIFINKNKQLFIWNNWKNLKISREGWRCRMLTARNQHSLFKKMTKESELLWVVEKNAKDLIPGWAMITPFSSRTRYTLIGKIDIGLWVVVFTLLSSIISCSNFLITYRFLSTLNNRKMRDARSFFSEAIIVTCWMTILANPMLILGILMLISDRHWKTSFFDYSGGGDTVLFQHMFWFFGHPEVYIIIVPCFGFVNTILSFYLRKRISARASLMYSMYTIAFLGFFVWGHHMYMVGLAHTTRMLYSTLTVMISVPAATKLMHWFITFINSSLHLELPLLFILTFIFFFISGGISGMSVAHTGMDVLFHDTFFVVGHFHVMLAGSLMFAGFAGIYFYLPAIFGVRYNRFFAYLHYIYYTIGQLFTVIPMIWLGYSGMPRRVMDYPAVMGGWHSISTSAHILSIAGILCFIFMLFDSLIKKQAYIIKTFGIGRYNTRLNFYLYECSKNKYWQSKVSLLLKKKIYTNDLYISNNIKNENIYNPYLHYYIIK